jgi:hypothetical protein
MRKSLLSLVCLLVATVGCLAPRQVHAQYIGNVGLQTTQQTLATTVNCTGVAQTFAIQNLGQTQHYASFITQTQPAQFQAEIDGIDKQGNVFRISDVLENAFSVIIGQGKGSITASGYYPKIQVVVTCSPNTATFSATYSGSQVTFNQNAGSYLAAQIDKVNFSGAAGNANQADTIPTPFGSTAGTIYFTYTGAVAGGTLAVDCVTNQFTTNSVLNAPLANVNTLQTFQIEDNNCPLVQVRYISGGAATSATAEYVFSTPGRTTRATQYTHIVGTTATAVKPIPGFLHTLSVNTGAAGTVSVFDLATAACTGTPSTNTVAVITATTTTLQTFTYDVNMLNGICVKASAAMDLTVSAQ